MAPLKRHSWLLAAVLVAGCGDQRRAAPAPSPTPEPPADRELIGRALERRVDRLPDGLGLRDARYRVERLRVSGRRARLTTRLSYEIKGVRGSFGSRRGFLARRRGGGWTLRAVKHERGREFWQVDDYARTRTDHFVVLCPKGLTPPVEALEAGYARLAEALPAGRLKRRYLVVVARDGDHARRLTRRIVGLESLTALTDTQVRVTGPALRVTAVGSQRLVVNLPVFLAQRDPVTVVAHELTHAALAPVTSGRVPAWLIEGAALYVSEDDRRDEYRALPTVPTLAGLSAPDALTLSSGGVQRSGYATASTAAHVIAERHGPDALIELLLAYNRRSLRGRAGDPELTDRALRRTLGTSLSALQRTLGSVPELPEVETIRRGLAPHVEDRTLLGLEVLDERWCRPLAPEELAAATEGRVVEHLGRRGKYLVLRLRDEVFLTLHLRMTGTVLLDADPVTPHTRVRFDLGEHRLSFVDPRRFGTGELQLGADEHEAFIRARLGLEPFEDGFDGAHLRALAKGRRAPVKAFLLDQTKVAGVGNIYADEALFRAGIHPLRPVGTLKLAQLERLAGTVIEALQAGIDAKGASIDDFRDPYGVQGSFQDQFLVHLREGLPCPECGTAVVKLRAAGRGTYVCPACQPRPRPRVRRPVAPSTP